MKKILYILFSIFISTVSLSQTTRTKPSGTIFQGFGSSNTWTQFGGVVYPVLGYAPSVWADTTTANASFVDDIALFEITTADGKIWSRGVGLNKWNEILTSSNIGSFGWSLTGNSGTTAVPNFIGTTDAIDVVGKANGAEVVRWSATGYFGVTTAVPTSKVHITTNDLQTTVTDASGLFLSNSTAATSGVTRQYSPGIVWGGSAWKNTGAQSHLWRAYVQPSNTTVSAALSTWKLQTNQAGGGYFDMMTLLAGSGQITNLSILRWNSTDFGRVNNVPMGFTANLFYGQLSPSAATGVENTSIGIDALTVLTSGSNNVAIGTSSMSLTTSGATNTAVGFRSLRDNVDGYSNVAVGTNAGLVNTSGFQNTFAGGGAGEANTTGQENTMLGYDAGLNNTTGIRNVHVGWNAKSGTDGANNVMVGYRAGASLTAGNTTNVFVGSQAGDNASQKVDATNSIAIGEGTFTTANNQIILGNTSISQTRLRGAIYFDGSAGTSNQLLLSQGTGAAPLWSSSLPSSLVPTLQQVLTAGSTLTGANTIIGGGNSLGFSGIGTMTIGANSFPLTTVGNITLNGGSNAVQLQLGSSAILTGTGFTNLSTQDRLVGQLASNGTLGYVTIGSGLSLASGVLSASGGGGVTTLAAIGSSANANGATISGTTLNLEPASASFGGVVTVGTQTLAGAKTLTGALRVTSGNIGMGDGSFSAFLGGIHMMELAPTGSNTPLTLIGGSRVIEYWDAVAVSTAAMAGMGTNATPSTNYQISTYNASTNWQIRMQVLNADGSVEINPVSLDQNFIVQSDGDAQLIWADGALNSVGIGVNAPAARLHIKAGTATASQAPLKLTTGTLLTTPEVGAKEYNNAFYETNNALNRYASGGTIYEAYADVSNSGTSETDLDTYTTKANTLASDGEKLIFNYTINLTDVTATAAIKVYFAGTAIASTGALTVSATGAVVVSGWIIRTSSTTARSSVNISSPGASTALYTSQTDLTSLTLSGTNIVKVTGQAGGAGGGSADLVFKMGVVDWKGKAAN